MDINWTILGAVVAANLFCCVVLQYGIQRLEVRLGRLPPRHSTIPGTDQSFLYWQDFATQTWGDILGLVGVQIAFFHLGIAKHLTTLQCICGLIISFAAAIIFEGVCRRENHKPDWGYPATGKISWGGLAHLPYFGLNASFIVLDIYHLIIGNLRGDVMWIALGGGAIYLLTFVYDIKTGHFDPLKITWSWK